MDDLTGMDFDSLHASGEVNAVVEQPTAAIPVATETGTAPDLAGQDFDSLESDTEKYGTLGQAYKAGFEGVGQGLLGPLAPMAEKALGVKEEDIRGRAEQFPGLKGAGEVAGLVVPALIPGVGAARLTQAGLLGGVGKGLEKLGLIASDSLASKIGVGAAKAAIENALISGSDEASKYVINEPGQSTESAIANIGMSAALGGVLGGAIGAVPGLWKASNSGKASQFTHDFATRIQEHINNPDPVNQVTTELRGLYDGIKEIPVFGDKGVKAQALKAALPAMNDDIAAQIGGITNSLEDTVATKLASDPNKALLEGELAKYKQALNTDDTAQIFDATQKLKQQLQEWGRYNKNIVPLAERPFRDVAKDLAFQVRIGLEDSKVWGEAAKVQKEINGAFSEFLPTLQDIEKTFTKKLSDGSREFDPGKVNTYLNQLGKPSAEIKQGMVKNFIEKTDKYKSAIDSAYSRIGQESPFELASLNAISRTLKEPTLGSRVADHVIGKLLTQSGSETLGAGIGASAGSLLGHPGIGAIAGARGLGPFLGSVLPAITKSILNKRASALGLKAATDFTAEAISHEKILGGAVNALFSRAGAVLGSHLKPSQKVLDKLDEKLKKIQVNADPLLKDPNLENLQHYMPGHADAAAMALANASSYLTSLRNSSTDKQSPFDSAPVVSKIDKAKYNSALMIAEQPMIVLDKIKEGTINSTDIQHLASIYPGLYKRMQQKVIGQMIDTKDKGETIPYKTRLGLSVFLGQPLDSTMSPASIVAAQPQAQGMPQGPTQSAQGQSKGRPSSPALQKMPSMYKTPDQTRSERGQRVK
jgi:hypothetical protein